MRTTIFHKGAIRQLADAAGRLATRGHRDEDGTISILSVFAVLLLTMLLGMVMNVGRQVDGKIRLQNAADAAAYSGCVVLARGMNSLAFTNQLLCEVFAMTAFMREARDRNAESHVPDILAAWKKEGPVFAGSDFSKFKALGPAITQKAPLEQKLVLAFSEWAAALAGGSPDNPNNGALPLMETILREHLITNYQRAMIAAIPEMAQRSAMTAADRNSHPDYRRGSMLSVLWQTSGQPLDSSCLASIVVDPNGDASDSAESPYASKAHEQRDPLAQRYLDRWNNQVLAFFNYGAKMCQFAQLWRGFTCGQLHKLLDEYPDSNLPLVIRTELSPGGALDSYDTHVNEYFTFLGVAYWGKTPELLPGLFRDPIASDALAFAEVQIFVPTSRLVWRPSTPTPSDIPMGGPPGYTWPADTDPSPSSGTTTWWPSRQGVPTGWNLLNEHWTCQLVPATNPMTPTILQTPPPVSVVGQKPITLPNLGGVNSQDLERVNYH